MRRREHRPRARYWMYFARKRLWKSLRIVSLTKVLPFFSGAPRAWWRKTTSSFQRLLTAPDGACVRINSKSKGAVKSLAGRRRVEGVAAAGRHPQLKPGSPAMITMQR